ncbi:MAG: tripartite tricarboxylate transporter substrate binding protein BugD [Alphaproteobacteria bacterium]|nr:MAG: tripartite tricarboxylate transporter substrate binding protein BugD [Alphaproteobacteria bacterium]
MKIAGVAAALVLAVSCGASAEPFPSRPLTIIVPFPAGGPTDTLARILSERMRVSLGQPVIIESVTGAGASIGVVRAAQAAPDGTTVILGNWTSHVGAGAMYAAAHDAILEMAPISMISATPLMIIGKSALPSKDARELIAWLKANPGQASAATVGAGSAAHVCLLYFQQKTGTSFQLVPYRGGAPVMQDLVAGQIDMFCAEASQTLAFLRSGKIKAFAVMSKSRWPAAPDVPSTDEIGAAGMYISFWNGLWAPKGTPADAIAKLNAALVETLADSTVRARLTELGHVIASHEEQTPDGLAAFHKAEIDKWWPIIKAANIKPD